MRETSVNMAILRSRLVSGNSPGSDGAVGIEQEHGAGGVAVVANVAADQSRPIDPETIASVVLGTKRKLENKFRLFQSCQNSAKNFRCAFFQLAGTEELCLHPAKMSAKSFRCAFFQLAGTLKKGGSDINIPAKSTYVEFVPGFSTSKFGLGTPF